MTVVGAVFFLCGFLVRNVWVRNVWFALSAALVAAFLWAAYRYAYTAAEEFMTTRFVIKRRLIETLTAAKVPEDVLSALTDILGGRDERAFLGQQALFSALRKELGGERTSEFIPVVFKYAKD